MRGEGLRRMEEAELIGNVIDQRARPPTEMTQKLAGILMALSEVTSTLLARLHLLGLLLYETDAVR